MLIMWFLPIKACPICCSGCSASQETRVTRFVQPIINPLAYCICWTASLGRVVFPPWNEGLNFGSYRVIWQVESWHLEEALGELENRIGQEGGVKEGLIQTSFSCLIEQLCNEE